jgi:hypothetical protein
VWDHPAKQGPERLVPVEGDRLGVLVVEPGELRMVDVGDLDRREVLVLFVVVDYVDVVVRRSGSEVLGSLSETTGGRTCGTKAILHGPSPGLGRPA